MKEPHTGPVLYHVTDIKKIPSIKKIGLLPYQNIEMSDEKGVYMFTNKDDMDQALTNWLGDRFDDDDDIMIVTIDKNKITSKLYSEVPYEVFSKEAIPPNAIININKILEFEWDY